MSTPSRTLDQRREALLRANEIRRRRSVLKRDLRAGRVDATSFLLDVPDWVETMKVFDLLLPIPRYGRVRVNKLLQQCQISPSKTIGGMSERQRCEIVERLRRAQQRRAVSA